jgi:hypothetical protein
VPPSAIRHRDSVSQISPLQQSWAVVVHVPPLTAWQQRPPLQARPSQQRSPAAHGCARCVQQVALALSQRALPQQPELLADTEQAWRFAMHAPQVDTLHASGLQQSPPLEQLLPSLPQHLPPTHACEQQSPPSAQVMPLPPQVARWQCPSLHTVPEQHSSLLAQAPPSGRQPQAPLTQVPVQQSAAAVHVPPGSPQAQTPPVQVPRQQSPVAVQETRGPRQAWQAPLLQRRPVQHIRLASHRSASWPHAGAHWPPLQARPAQQGVPLVHDAPIVPQPV